MNSIMARMEFTNREPISVEVGGQTYFGSLITKGAQEVSMTVEYKGKEYSDGRTWGTDERERRNMLEMAQAYLLQMVRDDLHLKGRRRESPTDATFAYMKLGTSLSILASHPGRIQERLRDAYNETILSIQRENIPAPLLRQYDSLKKRLAWIESGAAAPSDDEARLIVTAIEDFYATLESEVTGT